MPDRSEQIGQLAAALAKAQGAMQAPKKDKTAEVVGKNKSGGAVRYSYHYSDLASLIDAVRDPLAKNELAFLQPLKREDGHLLLRTVLVHSSGEWISSEYPIAAYDRPQEQGSALTYARRYSLGALIGLAPEDDDGEAAQKGSPAQRDASEPEQPSNIDPQIIAVAEVLANVAGLAVDETILRASAFFGKDHPRAGEGGVDLTESERWQTDPVPEWMEEKGVMYFRDPRGQKSEKWKRGTIARLKARLKFEEQKAADVGEVFA